MSEKFKSARSPGGIATFIMTAIVAGCFVTSTAGAQGGPPTPPVQDVNIVGQDQSLDVNVVNSVEIKNTVGSPIGVIERPGNANYVISGFINANAPPETGVIIPRRSHMQGLTVAALAFGDHPGFCQLTFSYPSDPGPRPNNSTVDIVTVVIPSTGGTVHIPLADLFVGEGVRLTYETFELGDGVVTCSYRTSLQLRPLPGGILP